MDYKNYKEFAVDVAREAGQLIMNRYGESHRKDWHIATNFKIEVDEWSDELIRKRINEAFPEHNIFSEETEGLEKNSDYSWIIDPLDGTIPYTLGISDHFSICVALARKKEPIVGVINAPKREELYVGVKGGGAFLNGEKISASQETDINRVVMGVDSGKETKKFKRAGVAKYLERLYAPDGVTYIPSYGCASVPLAMTASGKLHGYLALSLEPWDMAAAVVINREAGAKVTNLEGKSWEMGDESILVANPELHEGLLNIISGI